MRLACRTGCPGTLTLGYEQAFSIRFLIRLGSRELAELPVQ